MFRQKHVLILSFTLLVVMLGYGMVLPVMPFYIEKLGAGGTEMGWLMSTYSLMQLIFAPLWGILSDRIGRKPVLAVGIFGYAITLFFFGLANAFWMLFLARTLSGILSSATMPTAMAYIGDHTAEKNRSGGMGQLGAAMGLGTVVGPMLGGLFSARNLALPFFIGSGLAALAFILVLLLLPEAAPAEGARRPRAPLTWKAVRGIVSGPSGLLLLLVLVMSFGLASIQGVLGLYVIDKFSFDTRQVGSLWMVMGGVMVLSQGVLIAPLTKRFGERGLIRVGLAGGALGFLGMSLASSYLTTLLALGFFTLALALTGPALNALISTQAGERQGTVMGLNSAAGSLGRIGGPLWAGGLYDLNIEYPYWSGAATLGVGLVISLWLGKRVKE